MKYTFENGIGEIYARAYAVRLDIGTIAVTVGDCEMVRLDVRSGLDVACGEADTRPDQGFQTLLVPDRTADVRVRVQTDARRAQVARHAVTEHLVAVHVDHTTI